MAIPADTAEAGSGTAAAATIHSPGTLLPDSIVEKDVAKLNISKNLVNGIWSAIVPRSIWDPVLEVRGPCRTPLATVKPPVKPDGKSPGSFIVIDEISLDCDMVQLCVAEAGGENTVIVAPVSPGLGAPVPSTKSYVTVPAWQELLAGASDKATTARATTTMGVCNGRLLASGSGCILMRYGRVAHPLDHLRR
jgi:hypothetical protein